MRQGCTVKIKLTNAADGLLSLLLLLQYGVLLRVQVGCSIKSLLCEQLGVSPTYVEERIKTVLLDGHAVDDVDSAIIRDGSTLAISAAMPGLVGATLRRGGQLTSLRSAVTHREAQKVWSRREGCIYLKLFNLLVPELGPILLRKGVYIGRDHFEGFLRSLPEPFWTQCKAVEVDSQPVTLDYVLRMPWMDNCNRVMLQVDSDAAQGEGEAPARTVGVERH